MGYLGLDVAKPARPLKRKDMYVFPVVSVDQIITNEETDERLPAVLEEMQTATAAAQTKANAAMPKSGDTFTGNVKAYETARTTRGLFNEETRSGSTTGTLQSVQYFINVTD